MNLVSGSRVSGNFYGLVDAEANVEAGSEQAFWVSRTTFLFPPA